MPTTLYRLVEVQERKDAGPQGPTVSLTGAAAGDTFVVDSSGNLETRPASKYVADFSTAWDAKTTATGPDGWTATGATSGFSSIGFSGGKLVATCTTPAGDKTANLVRTLTGFSDLYLQGFWVGEVQATLTTMSLTNGNLWFAQLENAAQTEIAKWGQKSDGSARQQWHQGKANDAVYGPQVNNDASYNGANNRHILWRLPDVQMNHRITSANVEQANTDIAAAPHVRTGALTLRFGITCKNGGSMNLSIASFTAGGLS